MSSQPIQHFLRLVGFVCVVTAHTTLFKVGGICVCRFQGDIAAVVTVFPSLS